ncbi:NAD(P)H-hydrate dehydratase [Nakamurella silvestris]|nr:NAD(P)H-hydrate dehydratase [Nakamurella silvestris]
MIHTYTAEQVRLAEAAALDREGQSALMSRAAFAVARETLARLAHPVPGRRAVLLVGTGNNGGDALFAGAFLRRRGVSVTALITDPQRMHEAGAAALRRAGGRIVPVSLAHTVLDRALALIGSAEVVIDGLVGLMARPPLRPLADTLVRAANRSGALRVAVDVPSGLDPDLGPVEGEAFAADLVVTFGGIKTGLALGVEDADVVLADLGIDFTGVEPDTEVFTDVDVADLLRPPGPADDKFSQGVLGIAAGSPQYPGAAVLSVGAAVRLRPGLVRYAGAQSAAVLHTWPEVVATDSVTEAGRVQAWTVGPGLGLTEVSLATLAAVLDFDGPVQVDADGLTLLSRHPELLERRRDRPTVLTPHAGEFGRLFPDIPLDDRLAAVRTAAQRTGVTVLLKGHRTLVASVGRTAVNRSGSAWLATAGSGDVLSGVIGSLLAHGVPPFEAAAAGAHLHGRAGERAGTARAAGARSLWDHLAGASFA